MCTSFANFKTFVQEKGIVGEISDQIIAASYVEQELLKL